MKTKQELIKELDRGFGHIVNMSELYDGKDFYYAYMTEELFEALEVPCILECCGYGSGETEEEALIDLLKSIKAYKKTLKTNPTD